MGCEEKKRTKAAKTTVTTIKYAATAISFNAKKNHPKHLLILVKTWTEVFFDEFSHKVRLSMNSQSLNLGHVLQEHVCWNLVIRVSTETVFEIIKIESKTDKSPH